MFTYCTQVLHLAEHAAYNRIEAARAARRFPLILTLLGDGCVHLSTVRVLAPHLTQDNHADVLREASHKSKREVEQIVSRLQPRPDVVSSVRRLPPVDTIPAAVQSTTPESQPIAIVATSVVAPPGAQAEVAPLAPERYKVQFTVGRDTYERLRKVQDLLRHPSAEQSAHPRSANPNRRRIVRHAREEAIFHAAKRERDPACPRWCDTYRLSFRLTASDPTHCRLVGAMASPPKPWRRWKPQRMWRSRMLHRPCHFLAVTTPRTAALWTWLTSRNPASVRYRPISATE